MTEMFLPARAAGKVLAQAGTVVCFRSGDRAGKGCGGKCEPRPGFSGRHGGARGNHRERARDLSAHGGERRRVQSLRAQIAVAEDRFRRANREDGRVRKRGLGVRGQRSKSGSERRCRVPTTEPRPLPPFFQLSCSDSESASHSRNNAV